MKDSSCEYYVTDRIINEKTPEKPQLLNKAKSDTITKESILYPANELKTPEKNTRQILVENTTPEKQSESHVRNTEQYAQNDGEDGMISTTEQARLLIAASKTPSKSVNKTPVKQNTPSGKRSVENSPRTPGKFRRVELITLDSPKTKKVKQF